MKLLGALGIDWKIMIIQAINFLVLFLILERMFFRPFIKTIKDEKIKEEEIENSKKQIEIDRAKWERHKEEEAKNIKAYIDESLLSVEKVVKKIKKNVNERELEEEKEAIAQIKKQSGAIIEKYKIDLAKIYKERAAKTILEIINNNFSLRTKEKIQEGFWLKFIKKLEKLDLNEFSIILEKKKKGIVMKNVKTLSLKGKKYSSIKKITINVRSSQPLKRYQTNFIKSILKEKLGKVKFVLDTSVDKKLIAGYSLEIGGILIEENFKEKIEKNLF